MTKRVKKYCLWLVEETMKQVLGESEERYRTLVELAPDGIATLDMKGVVTSVNTALLRLTGFFEDEIVGKHFAKLGILRAKEMPRYLKVFSYIARGKMPPSFQFVYRCKDGSMGWAEAHASFLKKDGKKVRVQAIIRDVTERKGLKDALKRHTEHLEELIEDRTRKLKESEGQYRLLLESISDSVYVLDREWRHVVVNDAATRFVRMPKEKLLGGKLTDLFPGVEKTTFFKTFKQVMKNRKPSIVTDEYLFKEGRRGWYEVHVYPVHE